MGVAPTLIPDSKGASGLGENWVHMLVEGWGCTSLPGSQWATKENTTRLQTVPGIQGGSKNVCTTPVAAGVWPSARASANLQAQEGMGRLVLRRPAGISTSSHIPEAS